MDSILTVTVPATSFDLTVIETVKLELGITNTDSDDKLNMMICQASQLVADYLNRVLAEETVSELYRLETARRVLILSRGPVTDIDSVTEDGTLLDAADYELDPVGLLYRLYSDQRCAWTACKIVVVYTAGYALLDDLPHPIERATLEVVKRFWFAAGRDPMVKATDVPGLMRREFWVGSVSGQAGTIPSDIAADISIYQRKVMVA